MARIALLHELGFRKTETRLIRFKQIDISNGCIELPPATTKNKRAKRAYVESGTLELLKALRTGKKPEDYVFTNGKTEEGGKHAGHESQHPLGLARVTKGAGSEGRLIHDLTPQRRPCYAHGWGRSNHDDEDSRLEYQFDVRALPG